MCDMVILGEDIPKQLKKNGTLQCYPGMEDSDDEDLDVMGESYDMQLGIFVLILYKNIFMLYKTQVIDSSLRLSRK